MASLSLSFSLPLLSSAIDLQVVDTIRKSKTIERLVYVSCNPEGAAKNLVEYDDIIVILLCAYGLERERERERAVVIITLIVVARVHNYVPLVVVVGHENFLLHSHSLCRRKSRSIKGLPFRPVCAIPVDLFPHTHHCELVILLERMKHHELDDTSVDSNQSPKLTTDKQTKSETKPGQ